MDILTFLESVINVVESGNNNNNENLSWLQFTVLYLAATI